MGHATHFLERLERVSLPQAELALSLYRDEGLLKYILQNANIPERAPRVAISLDHPTRGPFIIVTHSGHFVTCLGEGMSKGCWPVVTRDKLDRLAGKIEALRERIADSNGLVALMSSMPRIAKAKPEDFYLPAEVLKLFPRANPKDARYLIDVTSRQVVLRPVKAKNTPGRNQPCPCGSGKKYKRCCALITKSLPRGSRGDGVRAC